MPPDSQRPSASGKRSRRGSRPPDAHGVGAGRSLPPPIGSGLAANRLGQLALRHVRAASDVQLLCAFVKLVAGAALDVNAARGLARVGARLAPALPRLWVGWALLVLEHPA